MALVRAEPGRVWRITLSRPEARNAVSAGMLRELAEALGDAGADAEARVVLLDGAGPDFCAGADLGELEQAVRGPAGEGHGRALEETLRTVEQHPLPVVAAVHGAALGAGCQLAVAADLAVAAADAVLGIPAARLGVVLDFEQVQRLVLAVGSKRATALLVEGRTISGEAAAAWGMVNEAVPSGRLPERARAVAEAVAAAAPLAVRGAKRALREVMAGLSLDRATEGFRVADVDMMAEAALASEDLREGIRAFRERRPPEFRGS